MNYKNLKYFIVIRKLIERQMRWSLVLSRYNFHIVHVLGVSNNLANTLSRRDQDMPMNADDIRLQERKVQLIKPEWIDNGQMRVASTRPIHPRVAPVVPLRQSVVPLAEEEKVTLLGSSPTLEDEWTDAVRNDPEYGQTKDTVLKKESRFPTALRLKVSIAECGISKSGKLTFRGRVWVPSVSNLRTRIL